MYTGPKLHNDNLVFGYDTGYGIADKNTSTRFYPGRPTTNEINFANSDLNNWTSYSNGNDGTFTTEFGTVGVKINNRVSWNGLYKGFTLPSTGTYTFSGWFRYRGGTSSNNGATVYLSSYGGSDTATSLDKSKIGEWQRVSKTVNVTDLSVTFYFISYGGSQSSDKSSWDVTMPQIEKLSDETPFVNGSRSSTTSLIDLKRTVDIDLSYVSFHSTGQPTFDGTDDVINLPNDLGYGTTSVSVFAWYKINGTPANGYHIICGDTALEMSIHSSATYLRNGVSTTNGRHVSNDGNQTLNDGNYHYYGFTFDGSTKRAYIDGVQVGTQSVTGTLTTSFSSRKVGAFGGGYYANGDLPVYKVYNKVLTDAEVKQNYNAYKNRFNI